MSTRATYQFSDEYDTFTVYKHHDGYPEGAMKWIANAIPYAWELPRFEVSDFAAAFIAGNKDKGGGGVYCTTSHDAHSDTSYHYNITCKNGEIWVEFCYWDEDNDRIVEVEDTLNNLLKVYK